MRPFSRTRRTPGSPPANRTRVEEKTSNRAARSGTARTVRPKKPVFTTSPASAGSPAATRTSRDSSPPGDRTTLLFTSSKRYTRRSPDGAWARPRPVAARSAPRSAEVLFMCASFPAAFASGGPARARRPGGAPGLTRILGSRGPDPKRSSRRVRNRRPRRGLLRRLHRARHGPSGGPRPAGEGHPPPGAPFAAGDGRGRRRDRRGGARGRGTVAVAPRPARRDRRGGARGGSPGPRARSPPRRARRRGRRPRGEPRRRCRRSSPRASTRRRGGSFRRRPFAAPDGWPRPPSTSTTTA